MVKMKMANADRLVILMQKSCSKSNLRQFNCTRDATAKHNTKGSAECLLTFVPV